ncbi:probable membrane-associated kinase regulator 2 [Andrographis paniculata]|uniref:probable membrane-associated kinase regulator 2 n=1 Tax=Andrographis paniculata TaxID=175694 RepID=UPI0021E82A37|nr:probable membrane-associated kinase regulator 2 [Andrographis paniculata]
MEAFSLLKYWRNSGGAGDVTATAADTRAATKTIVAGPAAVSPYSSDGEDGPYFDLEFALPDQESDADEDPTEENGEKVEKLENGDETESGSDGEVISLQEDDDDDDDNDDDEEGEGLKFAVAGGDDCTDQHAAVSLSPSDELFFKGDLVSIEPSSILLNGSEENSKIPVFLLKSATKFRVLLLKLKKSKPAGNGEKAEEGGKETQGSKVNGKLFAVKFKVEEVPIVSLFTRDSSSKESHGKAQKHNVHVSVDVESDSALEEKKLTKEVVQKYLKMVKPFYVRVSKRYVEKLKFSAVTKPMPPAPAPSPKSGEPAPVKNVKTQPKQVGNNLQAGLKVVRKRLGKSRSASCAAVAAPPPPPPTASNRRDDSLLQVQDGIQSAILHCKRSFNATRDGGEPSSSSSILCRSVSDPSYQKSKAAAAPSSSSAAMGAPPAAAY